VLRYSRKYVSQFWDYIEVCVQCSMITTILSSLFYVHTCNYRICKMNVNVLHSEPIQDILI